MHLHTPSISTRIDLFRVSLKSEDKNERVIDVGFPDTGILLAVHNF